MSMTDGPDDWMPIQSTPLAARSSTDDGPDDWVPVGGGAAPAPRVQPTQPMPAVQDFDASQSTGIEPSQPSGRSFLRTVGQHALNSIPVAGTIAQVADISGQYGREAVTGFVEGVKNLGASSLKGHGAILATAGPEQVRRQIEVVDRVDRGETVPELDDLLGYQHMPPELRAKTKAELQAYVPTKVTEHPLYRAGEAVEHFGKDALGASPGWEKSWTRDIYGGLGSVAGGIGMASIPVAGPVIAGSTFLSSGQGEAAERAVKAGATEQQIGQAARLGSIAGGTDVVDALLPMLGSTGRAMGLVRRVGSAAIKGSFAEGGQEGLQQFIQNAIAQGIYKPDQDLMEDVPRNILVGAIVGGGVSGGVSAAERQPAPAAAQVPFEQDRAATIADGVLSSSPAAPVGPVPADPVAAQPQSPDSLREPVPPPLPASAPAAEPVVISPIEQRILTTAGVTAEQMATMTRPQIDAMIEQAGEKAGAEPVPPEPQPVLVTPQPIEEKPPTPIPGPNRLDLNAVLEDPRPAAEIKAEREAAQAWAPTADWQAVPKGANLNADLESRQLADGSIEARLAPPPGTAANPVQIETPADVHVGAEITAQPTPAQMETGNYPKRRVQWDGHDISIETEQGAERVAKDGSWSAVAPHPYGEIIGTKGADGDPLDITIGPNPQAPNVYVIDQINPNTAKFDEHKSFAGFNSEAEARAAYEGSFSDGIGDLRIGAITEMPRAQFSAWTQAGDHKQAIKYEAPPPTVQKKRAASDRPLSLLEFLASKGGLKPDPELRAIIAGNPFIPGFGPLFRPSGKALDRARESAVGAFYLRDTPFEGGLSTSTPDDLLKAISAEWNTKQPLYSELDLAKVAEREAAKAAKAEKQLRRDVAIDVREIVKWMEAGGIFDGGMVDQAVELVVAKGYEVEEAIVDVAERYAMHADEEVVSYEQQEVPYDGDAATRTSSDGQEPAPASRQPEGPPASDQAESAESSDPAPRAEQAAEPAKAPEPAETPQEVAPAKAEENPWAEYPDGKKPANFMGRPTPENAVPFNKSKPGDTLLSGDTVIARRIDRKAKAKKLADEQGGYLSLDGKNAWAVLKRPEQPAAAKPANPAPSQGESKPSDSPELTLATALRDRLSSGKPITSKILQDLAAEAYGAKLSEGKFDRKDMQDALELAVNLHIKDTPHLRVDSGKHAVKMLTDVLDTLPTQRVRTDEQVRFQQFSTPPNYAAAVAYAANLKSGDTVLEPSAGTGSLVAAASAPGVKIVANELSDRRAALLRDLVGTDGKVFTENAKQIDNILPDSIKPTVVVMNPPFSQTAGRMGDKKVLETAQVHIEQALNRLEPGGRLVAIVGQGMTMGAPKHRAWFQRIGAEHSIRASIGVDGKVYEKYGTTFGTRVYVIDKVKPTGEKPVTADVHSMNELMQALEPVRNGRPEIEQRADQSSRTDAAEGNTGTRGDALPASSDAGSVGNGERGSSDGRLPGEREAGAGNASEQSVRVEAGKRDVVVDEQSGRPGSERAGERTAPAPEVSGNTAASSDARPQRDLEQAGSGQSSAPTSSQRVTVEAAAPGTQPKSEISDSLYEHYEPRRAKVKGAKPHPGPLVESASMASVTPPPATYAPHLPKEVISGGLLSTAQLEPVIYAGQAHGKMLPAGEGEEAKRRGFFIGDGTGVGKGREIAGIVLDNWSQGRTKAIWISEKKTLLEDAKRDWKGLGQNPNHLFEAGKVKSGEAIESERGIAFMTYDTLKGGMSDQAAIAKGGFVKKQEVSVNGAAGVVQKVTPGKSKQPAQVTIKLSDGSVITAPANEVTGVGEMKVKSRVDQLVDWFGKDFDGVIAFDEAHNMGNASSVKGERGVKEAALKAIAGLELQQRLPNARVVYVSATGATEVSNLAYADRLGLWGRGTPFASRENFINEVEQGGIAAMELIARDMKQLGLYTARNLSYDGVEYTRIEHKLDANQREIYDTLAESWQVVLRNMEAALKLTGSDKDSRAKSAAKSAFWGGHQRFFNQIITSLQMPSVIKAVEADMKAGRQAVLQLTNTNEASQERAAAKAKTAEDIEDLDITPRDQIIQLVETSFPTQEYEEYEDENGKVRSRPVTDSEGNAVENKQAVRMREELIDKLASVRVPQGPLDMILDHFGAENVAEITGRGRRFILKPDEKTGEMRRVEEKRPGSSNAAETDAFQSGKKKILVFSEAGGTGRSYHADNTSGSKKSRRAHYLVQGGWRADKAVQGFGRTHRTNQASAPIMSLVTTDLQGQKRFISSIARRLSQLGALTKGQRQAGDQGIFSARDNLESTEATIALRQFYTDLNRGEVEGITIAEFEKQTGLQLRKQDDEGRTSGMREDLPPITQFLNRLLSLKIDAQNAVFNAFSDRLDAVIEARSQAGVLDAGLETVKADKISQESEKTVHTVEESGAETKYVKLKLSDKFVPIEFKPVANSAARPVKFWAKSPNGKIYAVSEAPSLTEASSGRIVDQYRIMNPVSGSRIVGQHNIDGYNSKWTKVEKPAAQELWEKEIEAAPEYISRDMHLITGAILPIWDRLKGSTRVVRVQTDEGERLIGRVVPKSSLAATLKNLGADAEKQNVTPQGLFDHLMSGGTAQLANGWKLSRRLVAGEQRIELKGPASHSEGMEVERDGAFSERINYEKRYFIPATSEAGARVLERITQYRPVTELSEGAGKAQTELGEDDAFAIAGKVRQPGEFTKDFADRGDKIAEVLREELDRLGLTDVSLKVEEELRLAIEGKEYALDGYYKPWQNLLGVSLNTQRSKMNVLHHEGLHALYRLGLFTEGEWSILTRQSKKWRDQYGINKLYADMSEAVKDEEGVAHAYAEWADGKTSHITDGRIIRLFKRIKAFLEALGNALRGNGFKTVESIFEAIDRGEIGGRERGVDRRGITDVTRFATSEPGADGKPQLVIPGAERMSQREIDRRKKLAEKRATPAKEQKGTDGLPLFGDKQTEMFAIQRTPAEKAVLDRVVPSEKESRFSRFAWNRMYTAIKDDLNPIKRLEAELIKDANLPSRQSPNLAKRLWEGKVSPLAAKDSPYTLARLTRGNTGRAEQWLEFGTYDFKTLQNTGKGLTQILKPVAKDLDGIRAYAVSKRTIELEGRGINTGVDLAHAQTVVSQGNAKYQTVFNELVDYQRRLTEYLHDAGILSDEGYAAMLSANKDYVPFFRMMDDTTELGAGVAGTGLKVRDPIRGIRGSNRQIIDPIESIIKNTYLFVSLAERNRALTALADLAAKSPAGKDLFEKVKPGVHPIKVTEREINKFLSAQGVAPAASGAMTIFRPNTFRPSPTEVALFRNGKREVYTTSPEVAEAVNALDRKSLDLLTQIASVPARTLRAGAVFAPEFVARNPVRDQFDALIFSKHGYIPIYDTIRGLGAILKPGGSEAYSSWLKSGGSGAAMIGVDRDYINENIIRLQKPGALNRVKHVINSPLTLLRLASELSENATRVGIHMRASKKTNDAFETGMASREGTLDFSRMGTQMRALNAIIPFLNAGLEGKDRTIRAFKERPLATTVKTLAAITLPSILLWAINHDDDRWKELEAWQRDLFWIILTDKWEKYQVNDGTGNLRDATDDDVGSRAKRTYFRKVDGKWEVNKGTVWKIPKPFELGILFGSLPERFLDAYFKVKPDAVKDGLKSLGAAVAPGFIPQLALPALEQATNHSFFRDRPLIPKYLENVHPQHQSTPLTSETAKKVGALLAKVTDKSIASPIVLENYVRQWTGSLGMSTLAQLDKALDAAGMSPIKVQPEKTLADMPVIKAFVARNPSSGADSIRQFYNTYEKRRKNSETVKYLAKTGETESAKEAAEQPLATAANIHKALGVQSKIIRGIYLNKEMTPAEKRTLIDNTYYQMIELSRAGLDTFRATEKQP